MRTYKGLRDLLAALVLSLLWTTPAQAPNLCTSEDSHGDARLGA